MNAKCLLKIGICFMPFLVGCSDDIVNHGEASNTDMVIRATQDDFLVDNRSRTIIMEPNSGEPLVMKWDTSDEIGVFTSTLTNLKFKNSSESSGVNADFRPTPGVAVQGIPEVAYYPYADGNSDRRSISVVIPDKQEYAGLASMAKYDFKAGVVNSLNDGSFGIEMQQLAALVRFEVNLTDLKNEISKRVSGASFSETNLEEQYIENVEINTDDKVRLTGRYTYNLDNLSAGLSSIATSGGEGNLQVKMVNPVSLKSSNLLVFYAVVAPGNHTGSNLTCVLHTGSLSFTFTSKILCDFLKGCYYTIPINSLVISHAKENSVKVVIKQEPAKPVYPSVDEETANCYMINTIGEHEFWGTQIGNGAKGIIKGAGFHTEDPYINPKSAKLLWQDVQNFVSDIKFNPQDGKVHYTANKTSGNAVIAVYDGPDGTGNVLWSWHIWGVGDEMPVAELIVNQAGAEFQVMNRTLGTHSANSYNATLYQWGRKDPFPNTSVYYLADGTRVDISKTFPKYKPTSNDVTILTSIQKCDQIIDCFDWNKGPNWLNNDNQYLWGDTNENDHYSWSGTGLANPEACAGWTHKKTIYDPSPVGYRVANKFTFSGFVVYSNGEADITGTLNEGHIEKVLNVITEPRPGQEPGHYIFWCPKFNNGYYFKRTTEDTVGTYFPNCGQRYFDGELNKPGEIAYYGYSAPHKNANQTNYMYISKYEWKDKAIASGKAGNQGTVNVQDFGQKRNANAIRCVME